MKQGQASSSKAGSTKTEPRSRGINPAAVADIGNIELRTKPIQMYEGRELEAPKAKCTVHECGSQGRYK